jgi:hypothetical protein
MRLYEFLAGAAADPQTMSGVEQELAFGMFQIATLTFAYNAVDQKPIREFMG